MSQVAYTEKGRIRMVRELTRKRVRVRVTEVATNRCAGRVAMVTQLA